MYYHVTNRHTLDNILSGDSRLHTLKQLAEISPDIPISVEYKYNSRDRKIDKLKRIYEQALANGKQTDAVFFTKDRYLPEYGDVIIAKRFKPRAVSENKEWTTIPDEYLRRNKAVSLANATIYVPDNIVEKLRAKYPKANLRGYNKDSLQIPEVTAVDRILAGIAHTPKLFKESSAGDEDAQAILHDYKNSLLVGSSGLGISHKNSDHDILIPVTTDRNREQIKRRIAKKYHDLYISRDDPKKTTFSGDINGNEFNIVLTPKQYADPFIGGYLHAKDYLDEHEEKRQRILRIKRILDTLPVKLPYKVYKKYVDADLGISKNYI